MTAEPGATNRIWGGTIVPLVSIVAIWAIACVIADPIGNFPLNDDWVYALAVRSVVETGRFALPAATSPDVIAQVYWGALFCLPLGFSFTALRLSTLVLGLAGVLAMFGLVREAEASRRLAVFAALTVAANPLYFGLANSFMSDVPFLALILVATWLFARGIRRESAVCVIAAFALAMLDILVRQFALAAVAAFGIAYVFRRGISWKSLAAATLPVLAGAMLHLGYVRWLVSTGRTPFFGRDTVNDMIPVSATWFLHKSAEIVMAALPYIGLFALPVLLAMLIPAWLALPRARQWAAAGFVVALAVLILAVNHGQPMPLFGNVLERFGLGPLTLRDTFILKINLPAIPVWLSAFWLAANGLGALAGAAVTGVAVQQGWLVVTSLWRAEDRRRVWLSALVIVLAGAYSLAVLLVGSKTILFDRYFLPLGALGCVLAAVAVAQTRTSRWAERAAGATLVVLAVFSVAATHDYLAWNRARWAATGELAIAGVAARRIDGGYEFNGWFTYDPAYLMTKAKSWWWVVDNEYVIASGPMPGYNEVQRFPFRRWLTLTDDDVIILRRELAAGG